LIKPSRKGFGRELIERALAFTLKAKTDLSFGADGVSCHVELPLPPRTEQGIAHHPSEDAL
jgi:two-component system CheB/CheR fusion protein